MTARGAIRPENRGGRAVWLAAALGVAALAGASEPQAGAGEPGVPEFATDVVPTLTKAGCNTGGCHGAAVGQGGFKLSLLGYDPELDFQRITRERGGRRLDSIDPANSLLLKKATYEIDHEGGRRIGKGSREERLLLAWIEAGAPYGRRDLSLESLSVTPSDALVSEPGESLQLKVTAAFSDGTIRDVTRQAVFTTSDEAVAEPTLDGLVTVRSRGLTSVMARYLDGVTAARVGAPFQAAAPAASTFAPANFIDEAVLAELRRLRIEAAELCGDAEFLRRACLDLIGALPSPEKVSAFLAPGGAPDKRDRLIDELLEREEFVDFWTMELADLLLLNSKRLGERPARAYYDWIRGQLADNVPYDEMARRLLVARGEFIESPASNFHRLQTDPREMGEFVSQSFLGVRVACARCHNHPFDRWTQKDYYQFSAFFARTRVESGEVVVKSFGEVEDPKTGEPLRPRPLGAREPSAMEGEADRRLALAEWITDSEHGMLARAAVNRVWRRLFGRGIVEPVDDIRVTNPPSNPALLGALTEFFIDSNYNLRELIRAMAQSRTYQLSSKASESAPADGRFFSHALLKPLPAQVLADAIASATQVNPNYVGYPRGTRAVQLIDSEVESYTLDVFGRCPRESSCEDPSQFGGGLSQVLHLMNGAGLNEQVREGIEREWTEARSNRQWIEALYLRALSRPPDAREMEHWARMSEQAADRKGFFIDLLWALVNSREFAFNH